MSEHAVAGRLTLDISHDGSTAIVKCGGKLVAGDEILYAEVSKLIPGSKKIVLDLGELAYMDSMGLGTMIRLYVSARSAGSTLELIHIGKRVQELLGMTNVLSVFTACGEGRQRMM
jgi:anti-sigma B factor antagonist